MLSSSREYPTGHLDVFGLRRARENTRENWDQYCMLYQEKGKALHDYFKPWHREIQWVVHYTLNVFMRSAKCYSLLISLEFFFNKFKKR